LVMPARLENTGLDAMVLATGKLVLHVLGAVAQFERGLLIERTMAGLKAARTEGRTGGRHRKMTPQDITTARKPLLSCFVGRAVDRHAQHPGFVLLDWG